MTTLKNSLCTPLPWITEKSMNFTVSLYYYYFLHYHNFKLEFFSNYEYVRAKMWSPSTNEKHIKYEKEAKKKLRMCEIHGSITACQLCHGVLLISPFMGGPPLNMKMSRPGLRHASVIISFLFFLNKIFLILAWWKPERNDDDVCVRITQQGYICSYLRLFSHEWEMDSLLINAEKRMTTWWIWTQLLLRNITES